MREGRNGGKLRNGGTGAGGRPKKLPSIDLIMTNVMGDEKNNADGARGAGNRQRAEWCWTMGLPASVKLVQARCFHAFRCVSSTLFRVGPVTEKIGA